ncbi:prepilin-type N-terminal cleavage/methylation domain-containing protein [Clostridium sp. LQ25]|uniref:type IV pilus modification PilV family protein n=1 Tax=Clostridium sp. LQ25 TaxID=2992805 RepID=UPI0022533978|nr:prepilin-type N-terminal cleavage/methylation domain-containing protein [Clostridium sp. LQ25]UZT07224.1 prepilin-type N-terminal cleavage/methylation domain-containing protein [Clostridium sp. LQ25]
MKFIKRKKQGFTLIEVAIGLTIGSMLIGGVYAMVISSLRNTSTNEVRQTSALFTQQLMEELKGSTVEVDKDYKVNGFENLSDVEEDGDNWKSEKDGYKAEIEINKNSVVIGEKESNSSDEDKSFCTNLEIDDDFKINNENLISDSDQDTDHVVINIVASINKYNQFEVSFRDKSSKELYTITSDKINEESISLKLNFQKCNLEKDIDINIFNQTDKKLLLTAYKYENINLQVNNKVGQLSFIDNQSNEQNEYTQLYDITIKVSKDGKDILKTESSQNLNVDMVGD